MNKTLQQNFVQTDQDDNYYGILSEIYNHY